MLVAYPLHPIACCIQKNIDCFGRTEILLHVALVRLDATALESPVQNPTKSYTKRRVYEKIK